MPIPRLTPAREQRIIDAILVDVYNPDERAMSWYYYLQDKLTFPFMARCAVQRSVSPLTLGEEVEVVGLPNQRDCMREMFVLIRFAGRRLGVPLSQLEVAHGTQKTREGVDDWRCWASTH